MSTKDPQTDYIDGFLRYDVLPEKTFAARGWDVRGRGASSHLAEPSLRTTT